MGWGREEKDGGEAGTNFFVAPELGGFKYE
jgi:hypothetical protein